MGTKSCLKGLRFSLQTRGHNPTRKHVLYTVRSECTITLSTMLRLLTVSRSSAPILLSTYGGRSESTPKQIQDSGACTHTMHTEVCKCLQSGTSYCPSFVWTIAFKQTIINGSNKSCCWKYSRKVNGKRSFNPEANKWKPVCLLPPCGLDEKLPLL